MDLRFTAEETTFRNEVRGFFRVALPPEIRRKMVEGRHLAKDDIVRWQRILNEKGWAVPHWPKEWGGTGWTPIQHYIFQEEMQQAPAPQPLPFGVNMVGPVIIAFGNDAQKKRYLPRILSSDEWWCQGYSEPEAGSDLAALKTRAVADGNDYIVSGAKTWTTYAQHADMMFCLARTASAGRKQEGISFLLIDMRSPGISIHPIVTMDGGAEINTERTNIARIGLSTRLLRQLKAIAREEQAEGRPLVEDLAFRAKIAAVEIELLALEAMVLAIAAGEGAGRPPGPESSVLKIKGSLIQQTLTELLAEAVGVYAMPYWPEWFEPGWNGEPAGPPYAPALASQYFNWRKVSIYGGSNEIQRNIVAKHMLGF
jgi:alkylation response protein AidB-like acyl-CoA dehydrogenase